MDMTPLTRTILAGAMNLALASLVAATIGLLLARTARRSAPLRHALAFGTVCLLLLLPATPFLAALIDASWLPQVSLIQWPTTTASRTAATNSTPSADTRATAGSSSSATPGATAGLSSSASPASGATGSTNASTLRPLTANEIPAGSILPGQSSLSLPVAAGTQGSTPPLSPRINLVAAGLAIVALWLLGTSLSLLLTVRSAARVSRLVGASSPVDSPDVRALLNQLASQLRLRRSPLLRSSSVVGVPFAWGPFRPVIVLPRLLAETGDIAQLQPVLLHELAHVRRRDVWIGLLQRIVAAMYWWNPLVHRLNAKLAEAREEICDAHVLAGGCPPREYAELLVDLAARISLPQPAAAPGLLSRSEPQLTSRVQHLLEDPPMSTSLRWFGKLALLTLIIVGTTTAILVAAVIVNEQRMASVHLAVDHGVRVSTYVPSIASTPEPVTFPATRPAAQTFEATDPFGEVMGVSPDTMTLAAGDDGEFRDASPFVLEGAADPNDASFDKADAVDSDFSSPITGTPEDELNGTSPPTAQQVYPIPDEGYKPSSPATGTLDAAGARPLYIGPGSIHGLAVIELIGDDDGSLKDLRWFTESLGNGSEAVEKLTERLAAFATVQPTTVYRVESRTIQDAAGRPRTVYVHVPVTMNRTMSVMTGLPARGPTPDMSNKSEATLQRVLAAQITASPQLRYEAVAKVLSLCEPHVQRVIIGQSDLTPELTLTLGFVRDGAGKKISASPVLIWNDAVVNVPVFSTGDSNGPGAKLSEPHDKIVEVHSLPPLLLNWRQTLSGEAQPKSLAARIRADDGVDPKLVEEVVQAILPAGFERVILEPIGPSTGGVQGVVIEIKDTPAGKNFVVSVGSDDGVVVGSVFNYQPSPTLFPEEDVPPGTEFTDVATLQAHTVNVDYAVCVLKSGSPAPKVGTNVYLEPAQPAAPPAVEPAVKSHDLDALPTY